MPFALAISATPEMQASGLCDHPGGVRVHFISSGECWILSLLTEL